jgi:hypothetical protein
MLVAARSAIHEAPAAAELTTEGRALRIRFAVLFGFATSRLYLWITLEPVCSFLQELIKQISCQAHPGAQPSQIEHLGRFWDLDPQSARTHT